MADYECHWSEKKRGRLLYAGVRPLAYYHDSFLLPCIEIGKDSLFQV